MRCGEVFAEQKDFLTQLDTEIGDADLDGRKRKETAFYALPL